MRVIGKACGWAPILWLSTHGQLLLAQTLKELESDLEFSRGVEEGGEPTLNLFTILLLAFVLLAIGSVFLVLRLTDQWKDRGSPDETEGEQDSYFLTIAFLATGYASIIIMLAYVPPAMTPVLGSMTRWVLIVAALFISIAHLFAARDERALPPLMKYLLSGGVVLAAFFFHLSFKQWSFLRFDDPFYHGKGPYIALGLIILLVLAYSSHATWQHFKKPD